MDPTFPLLLLLWLQSPVSAGRISPGSPADGFYSKVQHFEGETLSVQCTYKKHNNHLEDKVWCKIRGKKCDTAFTRVWVPGSSYQLKDDVEANVLTITMVALRRQDSGKYWCMRSSSSGTLYPLMGFLLQVSAAPTTKRTTSLTRHSSILKSDTIITRAQAPTLGPDAPFTTTLPVFTSGLLTLASFGATRSAITRARRTTKPQTVTASPSDVISTSLSTQAGHLHRGSTTIRMCHTSRSLLNNLIPTRNQESYPIVLMGVLILLSVPVMLIVAYKLWKKRHIGSYNICRVPARLWKDPPGIPEPPWKLVLSETT